MDRENKFPFSYFGHGTSYVEKSLECCIFFKNAIPHKDRKIIEKQIPVPLCSFFKWGKYSLYFGSDDDYDSAVETFMFERENKPLLVKDLWSHFEKLLEDQIITLNRQHPIAVFFKPSNPLYHQSFSEWHRKTVKNFKVKLLPFFEKIVEKKHHVPQDLQDMEMAEWVMRGFFNEYLNLKFPLTASFILEAIKNLSKNFDQKVRQRPQKTTEFMDYDLTLQARTINRFFSALPFNKRWKYFDQLSPYTQLYCYFDENRLLLLKKNELDISRIQNLRMELGKKSPCLFSDFIFNLLSKAAPLKRENQVQLLEVIENHLQETKTLNADLAINILYLCNTLKNFKKYYHHPLLETLIEMIIKFVENDHTAFKNSVLMENICNIFDQKENYSAFQKFLDKYRLKGGAVIPELWCTLMYLATREKNDLIAIQVLKNASTILDCAKQYPILYHNLACLYAQSGDKQNTFKMIQLAKIAHYENFKSMQFDQDLKPYQQDKKFRSFFQ